MDDRQLITTLALAEALCPSMNGASADRLADVLEMVGPAGIDSLDALDEHDQRWIQDALDRLPQTDLVRWERTVTELRSEGTDVLTSADAGYPTNLRMIHNRPPVLFVRGELRSEDSRAVAVVGTRGASQEGIRAATAAVEQLVDRGITILSGLAAGIDTAAHTAALNARGRTIAVFGTGIRRIYPRENRGLAKAISASGACVSQFLPGQSGARWTFPVRNIVTSGLSLGTVVIEAGPTSGAKLQAHDALRHGKRLFLLRRLVESQEWACSLARLPEVQAVDSVDEIVAAVEVELDRQPVLL
jgi:DNA processing protein